MKDEKKMINDFFKYVLGIVLAVCGWLITASYNRVNGNIQQLQTEVVQLKMQLVEISSKMIDEERVIKIVRDEFAKRGL